MTTGPAGQATSGTERASRSRRSSSRPFRTSSTTTGANLPANRPGGVFRRKKRCRHSTTRSRSWRWSKTRTTANSSLSRPAGARSGRTLVRCGSAPSTTTCPNRRFARRDAANEAIAEVLAKAGLGRFMKFTFRTANASHPVGGCRMADSQGLRRGRSPKRGLQLSRDSSAWTPRRSRRHWESTRRLRSPRSPSGHASC